MIGVLTLIFSFVVIFAIESAVTRETVIKYEADVDNLTFSPFRQCHNETPPSFVLDAKARIRTYIVNLDLPPEERWKDLVTPLKSQIRNFFEILRNNTNKTFGTKIFNLIDSYLPALLKTLPRVYYEELIGIARATGLSVGEITLFNTFYEFNSLCTSIVIRDEEGKLFHGRNLDFGFLLGWDVLNRTWLVSELLRPLTIKAVFQRNNETIFSSVQFAGYIGVLTGIKKAMFTLSVNERFKLDGGYVGLVEWILGRRHQKWNSILTREVMETANSYKEAQKLLTTPKLLAPVFFILSGNESSQGSVITRGRSDVDIWTINADVADNSSWYLVQANHDHWRKPPPLDDRIIPSRICLELFGRRDPIFTLYNVLSTIPVLNKETIYSAIMEPSTGDFRIWLQKCPDPCWPW